MIIVSSPLLRGDQMALALRGRIVYVGLVGDPIEDADCDEIILARESYDEVKQRLSPEALRYCR